jgi:hypothetical protein
VLGLGEQNGRARGLTACVDDRLPGSTTDIIVGKLTEATVYRYIQPAEHRVLLGTAPYYTLCVLREASTYYILCVLGQASTYYILCVLGQASTAGSLCKTRRVWVWHLHMLWKPARKITKAPCELMRAAGHADLQRSETFHEERREARASSTSCAEWGQCRVVVYCSGCFISSMDD